MPKMNLPNKLTILRFALTLVLIILFVFPYSSLGWVPFEVFNTGFSIIDLIVAVLFIVASVTDTLDGHIARKNHLITDFGKFMDPLADKALVDSTLILLAIYKTPLLPDYLSFFPGLIVCLFFIRDLAVDGVKMIAASKGKVIAASNWGKAKTVAQMIAIPFVILNGFPLNYVAGEYSYVMPLVFILIALVLSLVSGFKYLASGREFLNVEDRKEKTEK